MLVTNGPCVASIAGTANRNLKPFIIRGYVAAAGARQPGGRR
jgi:hypothetical protein